MIQAMTPKDQILDSAVQLFALRGFEGVSIREIAEHAQIHFASIRYHFGDKEELYNTCISLHGESRLTTATKYLESEPQSIEDMKLRLSFALNETFEEHSKNPFLSKLLLHEVENSTGKHDLVLRKTMVSMTEVYIKFFKKCQKKNFISNDVDPVFITQSLMGIIHHYMRTENIRERILSHSSLKNKDFREQIVNNIIKLYTH